MGFIAKLTRDGQTLLDLNSGRYSLAAGFTPPGTAEGAVTGNIATAPNVELISRFARPTSWSFGVRVLGATSAEVERGIRDLEFVLAQAGDELAPLYFEYRPDNNVSFASSWGQWNANRRIKIVSATDCALWDGYTLASIRDIGTFVTITALIQPYTLGAPQVAAQAKGGVFEDVIGTVDSQPRGLLTPEATTNQFTNPAFGHATWSSGWTTGSDLTVTQNKDLCFIPRGLQSYHSAKLVRTGATNIDFYQSLTLTVATYAISCYAKREDGAAVTVNDISLLYDTSALTTTYTSVGDGWYRLTATFTGIASAKNVGVRRLLLGGPIYLTGFQCELKAYSTPLSIGDFLGCAWAGTPHASTSSRTAPYIRLSSAVLNQGEGTICVTWTPWVANTHPNSMWWFNNGASLRAGFNQADDTFFLGDNTNTATSAAQTFSAFDTLILHFIWSRADGLIIYKNGVSIASHTTYTPPMLGANLYIGTDTTPAAHQLGVINGFTIYDRPMSAAEVLADYTNMVQLCNDDQRVDNILYLWTKDGDDILDNVEWSASSYSDIGVVAGVPGNVPAEVALQMTTSASVTGLIINCNPWPEYIYSLGRNSDGVPFQNRDGTVTAGALNGETRNETVTTSENPFDTGASTIAIPAAWLGKNVYLFVSVSDGGSGLNAAAQYKYLGSSITGTSDFQSIAADATLRQFLLGPTHMPRREMIRAFPGLESVWPLIDPDMFLYPTFKRSSGSATVSLDFVEILAGQTAYLTTTVSRTVFLLAGAHGYGLAVSGANYYLNEIASLSGEEIKFQPGQYNHLLVHPGAKAVATSLTATTTISRTIIIPKWTL